LLLLLWLSGRLLLRMLLSCMCCESLFLFVRFLLFASVVSFAFLGDVHLLCGFAVLWHILLLLPASCGFLFASRFVRPSTPSLSSSPRSAISILSLSSIRLLTASTCRFMLCAFWGCWFVLALVSVFWSLRSSSRVVILSIALFRRLLLLLWLLLPLWSIMLGRAVGFLISGFRIAGLLNFRFL